MNIIVRLQGSATSVVQFRLVGDGKVFSFCSPDGVLDDSGGNNTLRKWKHWLGGAISRFSQAYKQAFTVNRVLKRMSKNFLL